jgi:dUTP pyrophosphatase
MEIRLKRWDGAADLPLPQYATEGSAGFDLQAAIPADQPLTLQPGQRALVPTGFAIELPQGYELQVRPRSGLAVKHGIALVNAPGTVDADYRGQVCACVVNLGQEPFKIERGDRIAQGVIAAAPQWRLVEAEALSETSRGAGGFGSTGR